MGDVPQVSVSAGESRWRTVFAVVDEVPSTSWLLAGGLMVEIHARLANLAARPTADADFLIDVIADHDAVHKIQSALSLRGFTVVQGSLTGYTTRMTARNGDKVDLLVADHLPKHLGAIELGSKPIVAMPAGSQAVERSMMIDLVDSGTDRVVRIRVPDLLGALILKSAAWSADRTDKRGRHLRDAALLASLIKDPKMEMKRLHSANDARRLRTLAKALPESSDYWRTVDDRYRADGIETIQSLAQWEHHKRKGAVGVLR